MHDREDRFYFVIDTDQYSGNFERQLCAYITGVVGECDVGKEIADRLKEDLEEIENCVDQETDDHGCCRPVKIYPTPGIYNNGLGFHFKDGEEDKAKEEYIKYCKENNYLEKIDEVKNGVHKYPAYQSVAICLRCKLPDTILKTMCQRARNYISFVHSLPKEVKPFHSDFNITGFRFVTEKTVLVEEKLNF